MSFIHNILNTSEKDPVHWYQEGKDLSSRGYYLDALEALDRMLAIDPLHADSWFLKGYALYQMGKYEEGLQFFDQALIINPGLYEALTYKGLIYSNFGRHTEALELYDRALVVNASYTNAWYVKGLTLAIGEKFDEAIRCYEKALALEPKHSDSLAGINIAMKKREKGKGDPVSFPAKEQPRFHKDAVLISPPASRQSHPETSLFMPVPVKGPSSFNAAAAAPGGHTASPQPVFRPVQSALERPPSRQLPVPELLPVVSPLRSIPLPQLEQKNSTTKKPAPRTSYEEVIQDLKGVLAASPLDMESWCNLGDLYISIGKYPLATEAYERALDCNEENAKTWTSLGDARKKTGAYDEALFAYDRALEIDQEMVMTWISKAKTLAVLGRQDDAISSCERAIILDETCIEAWLYKGFLFKKVSRHADALSAYDRVLAINPHHDHAMRQRRTLSDGV